VDICNKLIASDICALIVIFSAGKLKENDLKYWFPVIELVLIFTQINIFIKNIFKTVGNKIQIKKQKRIKLLTLLLNYYWNEVYGFMLKRRK
jgi:hypothetical protein